MTKKITVQVPITSVTELFIDNFKAAVTSHPGNCIMELEVYDPENRSYVELFSRKYKVNPGNEFVQLIHSFVPEAEIVLNKNRDELYFRKQELLQKSLEVQPDDITNENIEIATEN